MMISRWKSVLARDHFITGEVLTRYDVCLGKAKLKDRGLRVNFALKIPEQ
jgi:hypothetical protein